MGLFQDHFSMLSELERLAAMVQDPARIHEIGADQWPLAMIACGLETSGDPARLEENLAAYDIFVQKTDAAARQASLAQLARFVIQRKGDGWRALLPYALREPVAALARKAAMQAATLAQPNGDDRFSGVTELIKLLGSRDDCPPTALDALLGLSDMRFAAPLEALAEQLTEERLAALLDTADPTPNRLSYAWVLAVLSRHPGLGGQTTALLERMAAKSDAVLDLVVPIPSWAYEKPTPQAMHGWGRVEYFSRLLPGLEPYLDEGQLTRLRAAFGA